jgi:hypothetical protein
MENQQAELLEKYKALIPLILAALAQVQVTSQPEPEPEPVVPEPEPQPEPLPTPVLESTPAPNTEELIRQAVQQYMMAAPPIAQESVNMVPKTIRDVELMLKNNPLIARV